MCQKLGGGAITSNNIVRPFYVHCQRIEVINVVIHCASWVNVNINNQIEAFGKWD